jgi:DNA primase
MGDKKMADWVDFKTVKTVVSIEMVLEHYSIELRKVNATNLRGACPLQTHVGDSETSFGVNTEKNAWACHAGSCVAKRDGKKGGNVLDFVAVMEGCTIRDAALKLQNWFSVEASNERPTDYVPSRDRKKKPKKLVAKEKTEKGSDDLRNSPKNDVDSPCENGCDTPNKPLEFQLKSVDMSHEYFKRRGIKQDTAEYFGTGHFHGRGSMSGRVVIPIHNEVGELIAYAGRSIDDSEPKYKIPAGFKKSLVLFNLHRAENPQDRVVVVEGFFDCLKVHQAGFPHVVALMGCEMSEHQEALLVECFDEVVIMLDGDEAGESATGEITERLMRKLFVRVVDVPESKQPDQLSSEEIKKLLAFLTK